MTDSKIRKLVLSALMAALCTVMTMVIQVPSPMQGYVNLGDCAVLISAWMLGPLPPASALPWPTCCPAMPTMSPAHSPSSFSWLRPPL